MNSNYKWREQTPSRLKGPKVKDNSCENGENASSTNNFVRRHQRNLSLPVNNVFQPTTQKSDTLTTMANTHGNGVSYSSPVHKKYQEPDESDDDSTSNSDTGSTGTYIIERNETTNDNKAIKSPDFDVANDDYKKSNSMVKKLRSSWVNEWHSKLNQNKSSLSNAVPVLKLDFKPNSPIFKRNTPRKSNIPLPHASSTKDLSECSIKSTSSDDDTKLLLKDAENCVSRMEAKVEKTSHSSIQYNRTFNLRRDRFAKPLQDPNNKNNIKTANEKSNLYKPSTQILSSSLSRVDCGRYSLRTSRAPQPNSSPLLSARKSLSSTKKWNSSILCNKVQAPNKETELENWKRRKNYDPMKAAAQGKKKDQNKQSSFSRDKSVDSGNPVLRSASFHGRDVFSQEDDSSDGWEQKSLHFYQPIDDWHKLPQPPATSRDHSPPPSKTDNLSSSANSSLAMLPHRISAHNGGSPMSLHKSLSAFNSSTSSSLDVSSMPDALFDDNDTLDMVQLTYKAKKRGIELMKRIRNELPEYDDVELTKGIKSIDLVDDSYHVPMKSWGMSVSATNVNCVDSIFKILETVLFKDSECRESNSDD